MIAQLVQVLKMVQEKSDLFAGLIDRDPTLDKVQADVAFTVGQKAHSASTGQPDAGLNAAKDTSPVRGYYYRMGGHVEQCVERYLELANKPSRFQCIIEVYSYCASVYC